VKYGSKVKLQINPSPKLKPKRKTDSKNRIKKLCKKR
tara:strand:+ start:402 stop:512 length:111 start_codon:yes stop_codon:yes gene_type:complete